MHYSLVARGAAPLPPTGHLGDPFSTKIAKNRNENTVWEKVATRAPKSAQSAPKRIAKLSQKLRNRLPKPLRRRLFTKPADLHKTCTGMARLHVHPPWRALFSYLLHQKVIQKPVLKVSQNTCKKTRKGAEQGANTMPRDTPNATQGHQKSLQILTRERSGSKEIPREASGYPPGRKRVARIPFVHQK